MGCRNGEILRIWNENMFYESFFRQTYNLSENWDVGEVKPIQKIYKFLCRFTYPTNVGIVGCLACGMSRNWHAPENVFDYYKF